MERRKLLRHYGFSVGRFPSGPKNSLTDVPGVRVGHSTIIEGTGRRRAGNGPVRTGVTAIIPHDNVYMERLMSGAHILNGAGEVSGLIQIQEWGLIETPILLTNTLSVGRVSDSCVKWLSEKHPDMGDLYDVVIPVVGECDDSFLNDAVGRHIKQKHVFEALNSASTAMVPEGSVGAGTGMVCCDFKGGIGSSSRVIKVDDQQFTIGILVLSNFGRIDDLRVLGVPVGRKLSASFAALKKRSDNYGSIITVLATDLPLSRFQISWLCKRAALGIGRCGSFAAYTSGEIIVGLSTANQVLREPKSGLQQFTYILDQFMDDAFEATIEATEEAIINSLINNHDMVGANENFVPAIPVDKLMSVMHAAIG
ncbi:P1 family peptidase [bacterium]|nr:P1 family peptidase [bacterium]MCI0603588.1 P1 family peptidase [bacterium]